MPVNGSMTLLLSAHGTMSMCPAMAACASMVSGKEASLLGQSVLKTWNHYPRSIQGVSFFTIILFTFSEVDRGADLVLIYPSWAFLPEYIAFYKISPDDHTTCWLMQGNMNTCGTPPFVVGGASPGAQLRHHVERHILFCWLLLLCCRCRSHLMRERWLVPHEGSAESWA